MHEDNTRYQLTVLPFRGLYYTYGRMFIYLQMKRGDIRDGLLSINEYTITEENKGGRSNHRMQDNIDPDIHERPVHTL